MIIFVKPQKMGVSHPICEVSLKKWGLYISYVQPYPTDRATINRQKNERQNANASQNKKSYNATHKPTQL